MLNWAVFSIVCTGVELAATQYLNSRQRAQLKIKTIPNSLAAYNITTPEQFAKSQLYGYDKLVFSSVNKVTQFILSVLSICFQLLPFLWTLSTNILQTFIDSDNEILISIVLLLVYSVIYTIIDLPFSYYFAFVLEDRHGFNKITTKLFIKDKITVLLLITAIGSPILACLISVIKWSGPLFWFYSWLLLLGFSLLLTTIYPIFIAPLFNTYTPVEGELLQSILTLAKRVDFPATKVYIVDNSKRSGHMNAYFYGFFKNKRIVLYDTLVKELSHDEVLAILCHEFGHYKKSHTLRLMALQQVYMLAFFYLFGLFVNNIKLFNDFGFDTPNIFIGLLLFSNIYSPMDQIFTFVCNIFSRMNEYEADEFATHLGYDLSDPLVKLHTKDSSSLLVDPWYSTYHYTHPTLLERLNHLKSITRKTE
ncbi:hypothetical protein SAMD00019534_053860 [Acytostelium subglobosum LB1]|uniref:hypothetical protein n=1 Tax=Acytostelium subglobosum LB1 TaxID=1410327 RepID=UPI0006448D18|nr:hypothetical protein SAMD00019534_053860 [Acytostelium subglobosum LB1]GAM22211.1 hypothetical protein SAMD00019534_053860 [Acytostelium subglobosum LB1]|eukprot:XP_012755311.1 hypothetical protein SAMD00019534_053860 [Acytostelium subglobosum LB1]